MAQTLTEILLQKSLERAIELVKPNCENLVSKLEVIDELKNNLQRYNVGDLDIYVEAIKTDASYFYRRVDLVDMGDDFWRETLEFIPLQNVEDIVEYINEL